jgi:hypothetical protein
MNGEGIVVLSLAEILQEERQLSMIYHYPVSNLVQKIQEG